MILIAVEHMKEQLTSGWFLDILLTQTSKEELQEKLCNLVDSVPTAFDVDKVLERLEEEKGKRTTPKNILQHIDFVEGLNKAIKIIKEEGQI